ncbi:serine hydrolase domain-containing protein [Brevibacillus ginsengisoli]|uniref:serine hydrolase domain-containing protein n=1 Tax=Brevibacillus ginsengisoli TaxID=363854 RepID=UPI003CE7823B
MKRVLRVLAILLGCIIIFSAPAAFVFGSTTHSNLKGTETEKVQEFMNDFVKEKNFNGSVLVMHNGKVVLNEECGLADREKKLPFKKDTLYPIGSVSKSMTAIAILQLEEQGKISTQDSLSKYFPDFPNGDKIKLHHLLNHSSGLVDYLDDVETKDWTQPYSDKEIMNLITSKPLKSEPGETFNYISSGYYLLGKIIEKVSGENYASYLKNHIFDKANMTHTLVMDEENMKNIEVKGYEQDSYTKNFHPSLLFAVGGVLSTKEDLAAYIQAIESHKLLSESETNKMLNPSVKSKLIGYGYGWYIANNFYSLDENLYYHGGSLPGLRTGVMRFKDQDLTIVIFNNTGYSWNYEALGKEIASIIFNKRFWFYQKIQ